MRARLFLWLLVLVYPVVAADSLNVRLKGAWPYSIARAVAVRENTVYLGIGGGMWVLDAQDPTAIVKTGACPGLGRSYDLAVVGSRLYLCHRQEGLSIIDVSDSGNPRVLSKYSEQGLDVARVVATETMVYIGCQGSVRVLDATNPAQPLEVGSFPLAVGGCYLVLQDSLLYVADGEAGLRVLSVASPDQPRQIGGLGARDGVYRLALNGTFLYMCSEDTLYSVDVAVPSAPVLLGKRGFVKQGDVDVLEDIGVKDTLVVVACALAGLRAFSVANPAQPREIGVLPYYGWSKGLDIGGDFAYVAAEYAGLVVVDVADPAHLRVAGSYSRVPSWTKGLVSDGGTTYLATARGLWTVDVTSPESPVEKRCGFFPQEGEALETDGSTLLAVMGETLYVCDRRGQDSIVVLGRCYVGTVRALCRKDSLVFLARHAPTPIAGLGVVNVSDPSRPSEIGNWHREDSDPYGISVFDDYVMLGDGPHRPGESSGGFRIFDVSDPSRPTAVARFAPGTGSAAGSFVRDSFAFLCDETGGFLVVDVSSPRSPLLVRRYDDYTPTRLAVSGNLGAVADLYSTLAVIGLEDPRDIRQLGYYRLPRGGVGEDVVFSDGLIHLANGSGGYLVLEYFGPSPGVKDTASAPERIPGARLAVIPSPGTGRATVVFSLPAAGPVVVKLCDALGRKLGVLYEGMVASGESRLEFRTSELPAGTYIVLMETAGQSRRTSLVVAK